MTMTQRYETMPSSDGNPQLVLDRIQTLVNRIQFTLKVSMRLGNKLISKSLTDILKSVSLCSNSLFRSQGKRCKRISKRLDSYEVIFNKLKARLTQSTNFIDNTVTNEEIDQRYRIESQCIEVLVENDMKYESLREIMKYIRRTEKTYEFQVNLYENKSMLQSSINCKRTNLTYGSTLLQTWIKVCQSSAWNNCVSIPQSADKEVVIFGSSQGLLVFYTAYLNPHCRCVGYEILLALHHLAQGILSTYCPEPVQGTV